MAKTEEISQELRSEISEAENGARTFQSLLPTLAEELLTQNDRQLSLIETGACDMDKEYNDEDSGQKNRLCATLARLSVAHIHCQLNRIYLETMSSALHNERSSSNADEDLELSLQSEIDTLYDEIGPVTEMSIHHDYTDPFTSINTVRQTELERHAISFLDQVSWYRAELGS